ncbi:GTP 3',8-cyclase [subsurface metagenome]
MWNKIYKKDLLQGIWFPVNMKHSGEDMVFNYKVFAKAKKIVYIDIPKYYYTHCKDSIMGSKSYLKTIDQVYPYLERLEFISKNFPSLFNLAQKEYYLYLLKIYGNLKNNPHFDKDKKRRNLIKNYINTNYRSLTSNPLINRKYKVLLKIFKINFELGYLFFYHYSDLMKLREYYSLLPFGYLRIQKLVTRVLGLKYQRSRKFIEIDITYACNLKCYNCDRSCSQAPSQERMTVEQIRLFLDESIAGKIRWERIRILGGEPTLHPNLLEIIDMIRNWRLDYAPEALIELNTNGYGHRVREVLRLIPDDIIIKNSNKNCREQLFDSFNIAPSDKIAYQFADFRNGCYLAKMSGIGLTPYGYYPCAPAGAIDRVFGFDTGRDRLPTEDDDLYDQLKKFCRLCGHFERRFHSKVHRPTMSKTWENAYELYSIKRPILHRYGERDIIVH